MHTWSLAVEEQFYIVFPLVLYAMRRLSGRHLVAVVLAAGVASLAGSVWATFHKPGVAFYWAPFRAWELLFGALVALTHGKLVLARSAVSIFSLAGSAAVLASFYILDNTTPFPGLSAVPAVLGSVAIILAVTSDVDNPVRRALAWKPLVGIGLLSYAIYLWHWPILVMRRHAKLDLPDSLQIAIAIGSTIALSAATYFLLEQPIRSRRWSSSPRSLILALGVAMAAIVGVNGFTIARDGFLFPVSNDVRSMIAANNGLAKSHGYPCAPNYRREIVTAGDIVYCSIANPLKPGGGGKTVVFWGDSYMAQMYTAVAAATQEGAFGDRRVVFSTSHGCQPMPGLERREPGYFCASFNKVALERAARPDVGAVVVGAAWKFSPEFVKLAEVESVAFGGDGKADFVAEVEKRLTRTLTDLAAGGKKIVIVLGFPVYPEPVPDYLARRLLAGKDAETILKRGSVNDRNREVNAILKRVAARVGAATLDPVAVLCPKEACLYHDRMRTLYADSSHLNAEGSLLLSTAL